MINEGLRFYQIPPKQVDSFKKGVCIYIYLCMHIEMCKCTGLGWMSLWNQLTVQAAKDDGNSWDSQRLLPASKYCRVLWATDQAPTFTLTDLFCKVEIWMRVKIVRHVLRTESFIDLGISARRCQLWQFWLGTCILERFRITNGWYLFLQPWAWATRGFGHHGAQIQSVQEGQSIKRGSVVKLSGNEYTFGQM